MAKRRVRYRFKAVSRIIKTIRGGDLTLMMHIPFGVKYDIRYTALRAITKL
jgi:hypothetical protein